MKTRAGTSASAVSRALRKAGFLPVPSPRHEGVRVSGGYLAITVVVQLPDELHAKTARAVAQITEVLTEAGYSVSPHPSDASIVYVTKEAGE